VLRQKTLIGINKYGQYDMHDLVQEMGHYVVREKHPVYPEKHSRVWKREDVRKMLAMDSTTVMVNLVFHVYVCVHMYVSRSTLNTTLKPFCSSITET